MRQTGLTNTLLGQSILLQSGSERVLASAGVLLVEQLGAGQAGTGNGMVEGLRLGLRGRGRGQSSLCFGGSGRRRKQLDLLANGATKILEGLLDVGGVVIGFIGVLGAVIRNGRLAHGYDQGSLVVVVFEYSRYGKKLLVNLLQGIHPLLQVNVIGGKLGLQTTVG